MAKRLEFPATTAALVALREFNRCIEEDRASAGGFTFSPSYQMAQARALDVSRLMPVDLRDKLHNALVHRSLEARGFAGAY